MEVGVSGTGKYRTCIAAVVAGREQGSSRVVRVHSLGDGRGACAVGNPVEILVYLQEDTDEGVIRAWHGRYRSLLGGNGYVNVWSSEAEFGLRFVEQYNRKVGKMVIGSADVEYIMEVRLALLQLCKYKGW